MNEEVRCMKCGFKFDDEAKWLYDLGMKWGHWFQVYPGKYRKQDPGSTTTEALRCKCERCGYQWLMEPES